MLRLITSLPLAGLLFSIQSLAADLTLIVQFT
jgi:hypothetical protein